MKFFFSILSKLALGILMGYSAIGAYYLIAPISIFIHSLSYKSFIIFAGFLSKGMHIWTISACIILVIIEIFINKNNNKLKNIL